jgi:hypothetical protein
MANDYGILHENCKVDSLESLNINEGLTKRKDITA